MKQITCFLLLSTFLLGETQGHTTYIINLNCSKFEQEQGEVFHPYRSVNRSTQLDYCTECRCDKMNSIATCEELECPELRCQKYKIIQKEGECCKSCNTSGVVLPATLAYVNKCKRGGNTYTDLTVIPSLNASNPCEVCYCWEGELVCDSISKTCPKPRCRRNDLIWDAKYCCPRCPPGTSSIPTAQDKTCKEHGITYQDGDTWNPYYSGFGVLDCYLCTCKDGGKTCHKVPCPDVRACTDDDPYEDVTICCPKCSRIPTSRNSTDPRENSTYQPPTLQPSPPTSIPCKEKCSHNVYESAEVYKEQIAIEFIIARSVDVYVWSTDFSKVQYESYTSKSFSKHFIDKRFRHIGCVTPNAVTKLRHRFNSKNRTKNLTFCQEHCAEQVIEILQPVDMQEDAKPCS